MAIRTIYRFGLKLLLGAILAFTATAGRAEAPKRGGVLTYMIPADAGPSLDGHRETTYAVVHATAPFYSVLNKEELQKLISYWPDIEKSRTEARRLLKEAGQENLTVELLNRNVDQPYKIVGTWLADEWSKVGIKAAQKVVPTGPWFDGMGSGEFDVALEANCQNVVNPVAGFGRWLPHEVYRENYGFFSDPQMVDIYNRMLKETDVDKARVDS